MVIFFYIEHKRRYFENQIIDILIFSYCKNQWLLSTVSLPTLGTIETSTPQL